MRHGNYARTKALQLRRNFAPEIQRFTTPKLAGAGLFTGYAQKRAHEEHARRYERMSVLFKIAGERVELLLAEKDPQAARTVLMHLGREALAETCDWLILHREREIEVPTA